MNTHTGVTFNLCSYINYKNYLEPPHCILKNVYIPSFVRSVNDTVQFGKQPRISEEVQK